MQDIDEIIALGEGQRIEFKQSLSKKIAREMVAFGKEIPRCARNDSCARKDSSVVAAPH